MNGGEGRGGGDGDRCGGSHGGHGTRTSGNGDGGGGEDAYICIYTCSPGTVEMIYHVTFGCLHSTCVNMFCADIIIKVCRNAYL